MKKFIKIVAILFALLIVAAIAIPFLVPLDSYKGQIISQVKEKTGRDLVIDGSIKATIFPVLGVQLGKTSLSNPKGYTDKNMLDVDGLTVQVSLSALLNKQLQIKQFILTKPLVNLEVNGAGRPNWEFGEAAAPAEKTSEKTESSSNPAALLGGLMIGDVKISDGEINYRDAKTKKAIAVKSLNLSASLPSLSQPFAADGNAIWNGEKVAIKVSVAKPDQIIDGKKSAFAVEVVSSKVTLRYSGEATDEAASGNVDLNIPSIPALAKWTGGAFDWKGSTPLAFSVKGDLDASASAISLKKSEIALDTNKLQGDVNVKLQDKEPNIDATLASDALDLNPFLKQAPDKTSWLINSAFAAELSNQPINLSGLNSANAKIKLTLGSILYEKVKIGKTIINADLNNGALKLNIPEMALYGGGAKINTTLDSSGSFSKQLNIANVNVGELVGDLSGKSRFSGTMNAEASLNGHLTSVLGAMKSLGGNGSIKITDGKIKGIDLKNMANNIKSAVTKTDNPAEETAFSELGGTFTIAQGIVSNNDLSLKSQALALSGKGTVNLPMQTINYRLNPELASTVKRGDGSDTKGLEVPIIVEGPLDNPRFMPDVAGMIKSTLENPNALKNTVKTLEKQFKEGKPSVDDVKNLLKGFGVE